MEVQKTGENMMEEQYQSDEIVGADYLRLQALRNVIYHNARRYWLEALYRWTNFLVVLSGTATAASMGPILKLPQETVTLALGALTAILGASSLVFDFAVRAKNHEIIAKQYFALLGEIDGTVAVSAEDVAKWKKAFAEIAANEPPTMRALDAVAQNEASQAIFGDDVRLLEVTWYQRAFKNVWAFGGAVFNELPSR